MSVVVVTHNSADVVESCLIAVRTHFPKSQIIIVDNASSDGTLKRSRGVGAIMEIRNPVNLGFGRACNQGARVADGSHVVFLNPDVRVLAADLVKLQEELARQPFGLRGPLFRAGSRSAPDLQPDRTWPLEVIVHTLGPLRPRELPVLPKLAVRRATRWPCGAMLVCSRVEFLRVGGFKPEYFLYYEDRDLARRYRLAGLPVGTTCSIIASHTPGTSSASAGALRTAAHGWAYLSWIEYLSAWHGQATARRAVVCADWLRDRADRVLALLESRGPVASRARRKRAELWGVQQFLHGQSMQADGIADGGFCPHAREIIADRAE